MNKETRDILLKVIPAIVGTIVTVIVSEMLSKRLR